MTLVTTIGIAVVDAVLLPLARSSWPVTDVPVPRLDDVIGGVLVWAALGLTAWLTLTSLLTVLGLVPGAVGRSAAGCAEALTPALVGRVLAFVLGTGISTMSLPLGPATGAPVAATAAPHPSGGVRQPATPDVPGAPEPGFAPSPTTGAAAPRRGNPVTPAFAPTAPADEGAAKVPDPRWLPVRPPKATDPDLSALLAPTPRTVTAADDLMTVRKGDSLWSLAARQLGPGATDRQIALAWPAWYALNADVIGADPDLIRPGQQLRIPDLGEHR